MSTEPPYQRHRISVAPQVGRALRLTILAVAVAPMMRWAVVYGSARGGQNSPQACPHCETRIGVNNWRPLTPLGRCQRCRRRLGAPPWSVEAVLLLSAVTCAQLPTWIIPAYAWWAVLGVILSFIDLATHRLPDRLTWPAAGGFLLLAGLAAAHGYPEAWLRAALSAVLLTAALGICVLIWPSGLGRGDAKYGAAIGAAAGWTSWLAVYASIVAASLLGALVGIALVVARRASRRTQVPFGPFLFLGTLVVVALLHMCRLP